MKLKRTFQFVAAALILAALLLLLWLQNPRTDQLAAALYIGFGTVLALSAASLFTGELFERIETLEKRIGDLENEIRRSKSKND